ncbi:NHL repeat-containing protein [Candidatus Aminicenantes bacterium AC-335-B20]|nr:NHL repeat-containing protein [SCandidatus Aminicenantes bacterium Aminicenantia_JdfR_composite]MCP2597662.1 NHL repeat-containing protein [Candidatus Aminicenantes bacterium AC-335-G13]MCP2599070.1 NHL repeat-containing protein [Candidatus Aminicenantes bacterium AC-335-B20]MCP2606402.1 NHL repeat-containing protein [Candidatus Aminicenantes bacterium AC-708-I09]MCP2619072.1 NHL repeat-containing protein [Candidatus Aminicenantes bacterium AC-335-A11]
MFYLRKLFLLYAIFCLYFNLTLPDAQPSDTNVLVKIGEIYENFSKEEADYFWHIDDICCDDEGNLYVADAGWNKIFKFDSKGNYITSFGREGQGPGEFLAKPRMYRLAITYGNDGFIYVLDSGNRRITKFSKNGEFKGQFKPSSFVYDDSLVVNSRGEIFLISKYGDYVVNVYNKEFKLLNSILPRKIFYKYKFYKEPERFSKAINHLKLKKVISKKDHIFILSNISLRIYHYDEKINLVKKFEIKNKKFEEDYKKGLKESLSKGRYRVAFHEFLSDNNENLYLFYFNSSIKKEEIYIFRKNGSFVSCIEVPNTTDGIYCINNIKNIYAVLSNTKIIIYKKKKQQVDQNKIFKKFNLRSQK